MKALVTGATGFIGGHLVEALLARNDEVKVLVRPESRTGGSNQSAAVPVKGDYRDPASLARAVSGMDVVFHVGGLITAPDDAAYNEDNVLPTRALISVCAESAPALKRFVFVSSISATGPSPAGIVLDETAPLRPVSGYGRSKAAAEEITRSFSGRVPWTILRPSNVLGPRQKELFTSISLIGKRIKPLIGNGRPQTSVVSVWDVVRALILSAEHPAAVGRTYFVTSGRPYAWREITDAVASELGVRCVYLPVPYPIQWAVGAVSEAAAGLRHKVPLLTRETVAATRKYYWNYDDSRVRRELGFEPGFDMAGAIRKTVAWYAERGLVKIR
ncbi:MAG: NAD-dependent epimerase/dehydratase family protein [Candidatus Aminicenantes bacterium]|nr:NAD-dependent epimerase/dehydratase family protein [Candidatus Aminicenantes bacterium]